MALPVVRAVGAKSAAAQSVAVAAPTGVATGDLEIMIASCVETSTISITANGGGAWTALSVSPQSISGGGILYTWYRIRAAGDSDPTVQASVSDVICAGRIAIIGGSFDPVTPLEIVHNSSEATSDTSFSYAPGTSTAGPDRLCFAICSSGADSNTGQAGTATNASLANLSVTMEYQSSTGAGAGFFVLQGNRAAAGAIGTWSTTTTAASSKVYFSFSVRPYVSDATGPVTSALDTFNAGAGQNLTSRSGWGSGGDFFSGYTTLVTDGAPTYASKSSAGNGSNYWGAAFATDQEVWTVIGSVRTVYWLYDRADGPPGTTYYELEVDTSTFKITRSVAGSTAILRSIAHFKTLATGDSVLLRSKGSYHEVWYKAAAGSWEFQWAVFDDQVAPGTGQIAIASSTTNRVDSFAGGALVALKDATFTSAGASASTFGGTTVRKAVLASAGTSTSTFTGSRLGALKNGSLTSAGASTSTFGGKAVRRTLLSSAGTSTSTFSLAARRAARWVESNALQIVAWDGVVRYDELVSADSAATPGSVSTSAFDGQSQTAGATRDATLTSTGASASTFSGKARRVAAFTSTGASTSTFSAKTRRKAAFSSTGASTSAFVAADQRVGSFVSASVGLSGIAPSVRRKALFASSGASTSRFGTARPAAMSSASASTTIFGAGARRAAPFTSAGASTSAFGAVRRRAASFASAGASTSLFARTARRRGSWTSAATSTTTFSLSRALFFDESTPRPLLPGDTLDPGQMLVPGGVYQGGYATTTIAVSVIRVAAFPSASISTTSFQQFTARPAAMTSAATSTSEFHAGVQRRCEFNENTWTPIGPDTVIDPTSAIGPDGIYNGGFATSTFSLVVVRGVGVFSSASVSTSAFTRSATRVAAFASASTSGTTFARSRRAPGSFTSASTSTSTFARVARRAVALSSVGASTSTFGRIALRIAAFPSTGSTTSTFTAQPRRLASLQSAGASTSLFSLAVIRIRAMTSASISTTTFHGFRISAGANFNSLSLSSTSFSGSVIRAAIAASASASTSTFAGRVVRALRFDETIATPLAPGDLIEPGQTLVPGGVFAGGFSTTSFAGTHQRNAVLASASTSTTSFSGIRRVAAASLSSTGSSASTFLLVVTRVLSFQSDSHSTSTFTITSVQSRGFQSDSQSSTTFLPGVRALGVFASSSTSTTSFGAIRFGAAALSSTGSSASTFHLVALRRCRLVSTATSTSTFTIQRILPFVMGEIECSDPIGMILDTATAGGIIQCVEPGK